MATHNIHREKGAISGIGIGLLAVVVLALIGIGWMWKKGGIVATSDDAAAVATGVPNTGTDTGYTYTIATSTPASVATADDTTASAPRTETRTVTTYVKKTVPVQTSNTFSGYTGVVGSTYHNGTYGLTVRFPSAGWTNYETQGGPAGLPGTTQIHFVAPGENQDAFVINVWGKAGWNYVRTQENFVHQNTTNIGEGTYLGENFTWIYSYTINSHPAESQAALDGAVFY